MAAAWLAACAAFTATPAPAGASATAAPQVSVSVSGNQLVNQSGQPVRMIGMDRSGTEYACVQGWGVFDGPSDAASIQVMASWHVTAVRVPLNEDCWLGINGVKPTYSGANYRAAIATYVGELNAAGLIAILDLHWSAPGTQLATGQQMMADADYSPTFWVSVATMFKSNPSVVFDLYNEPHGISWSCWLNGCLTPGGWAAAGMQSLLDAVRSTGATQPVLVEGLSWANDLSQWLTYEPSDPAHQLVASAHVYDYNQCNSASCWNATFAPVAAKVPLVTGEIGESDCASGFVNRYMAWADLAGVSYLAWSWNTANCALGPALITSYSGTPTAFGAGFQAHLASLWAETQPPQALATDGYGGLDPVPAAGLAPQAVTTSASWPGWDIARGAAFLSNPTGGYVLDGWGGIHPFRVGSNAMPLAATLSAYWPQQDLARGVALLVGGTGGYVLDDSGGVHPFAVGSNPLPPAATTSASWPAQDVARGLVLLADGSGGYVLDGYGGVHPFAVGSDPMPPAVKVSASWPGWNIARSLVLVANASGGYVLDGWGGVHPFGIGSNPMPPAAATTATWPNQDVASSIALYPAGTAGYVLTRTGQVAGFAVGANPLPATTGMPIVPAGAPARSLLLGAS